MDCDVLPVQIKRLPGNEDLPLPAYQTGCAAAMDVHAAVTADIALRPMEIALIPCGFALAIPEGFEAQIRPRSGLAVKHYISIPNSPATIDADYRGEVMVPLMNLGSTPFTVTRGMRIAQMLFARVCRAAWQETDDLPHSARGAGGFGHTGL